MSKDKINGWKLDANELLKRLGNLVGLEGG